jgi:hypothetical protein
MKYKDTQNKCRKSWIRRLKGGNNKKSLMNFNKISIIKEARKAKR